MITGMSNARCRMGAMKSDGGLHSAFDVLIARFGKKTQSGFPKKLR
jgi:hypothetical protein